MRLMLVLISILAFNSVSHADWTEKVSMKGDFRFRNENIQEEQASGPDHKTFRQRLRLRLGLNATINEETTLVTRIATGSTAASGATSTNDTMDNYEAKKDLVLDLAYFNWSPQENLNVLGGKMASPFYATSGSDLYFDTDLSPEGLAVQYKAAGESCEYMVNFGSSWLDERNSAVGPNTDVGLVGAQLAGRYKAETWNILLGVAQYTYANIKGATSANTKGNTLSGGNYANDYNVMNYMLELGAEVSGLPVSLYAEMIQNTEADTEDTGSIYGVKIGKLKEKKDWALAIDYRELEADATLGTLADSDVSGGGTDITGTRVSVQNKAADNFTVALTYMMGENSVQAGGTDYTRSQLDLSFSF